MLAGDVKLAADTFNNFIAVWQKYGVIPERYHYLTAQMHSTERHYPLRPELMESALYLMQVRRLNAFLGPPWKPSGKLASSLTAALKPHAARAGPAVMGTGTWLGFCCV